jgi:hypothetical protein
VPGRASPEEVFASISSRLLRDANVHEGTGFGRGRGLRFDGKIFAFLAGGQLVVKLAEQRVGELVAGGSARPFDRGQGRPLRQWVAIPATNAADWPAIAEEALAFARRLAGA